jgi:hypothetical protein
MSSWMASRPWRGEPEPHSRGATWQPPADRVTRIQPDANVPPQPAAAPDVDLLASVIDLRASGLKQSEIAERTGVHQSTVSHYLGVADELYRVRLRHRRT